MSRRTGPQPSAATGPKLSEHPRASRSIRRAKCVGGLVALLGALLLSLQAHLPAADAGLRALACGAVAYLVVWAVALVVWTQIARAEIDHHTASAHEPGGAA